MEQNSFDKSEVKKMSIADNIYFAGFLSTLGVESDFYDTLVEICYALGYQQDEKGKNFIKSLFDEFNKYLIENSTNIPPPAPELKLLLIRWIAKQNGMLENLKEYMKNNASAGEVGQKFNDYTELDKYYITGKV